MTKRIASPEETERFMNRVLDKSIKPHAEEFAEICLSGRFACVTFELSKEAAMALEKGEWGPRPLDGADERADLRARMFDLRQPCFALSDAQLRVLADTDPAAGRWCAEPPSEKMFKILIWCHNGSSLLVNYEPNGRGWHFAPGSLDTERN